MGAGSRVVYEYDVPAEYAGLREIKTIGLVELTAEEEMQATRRARGDGIRLAFELSKQSLHEVNGEKINHSDGSGDRLWNEMPPKVRNLVLRAYTELHSPDDEATMGFTASRRVKV